MSRPRREGIRLGRVVNTGRDLIMPEDARYKHLYVTGATGTGKSKFLENMIRQDIADWRRSKAGLVLIDPHGGIYDAVMRWLATWK